MKKILLLILTIVLIVSMTACGNSDGEKVDSTGTQNTEQQESGGVDSSNVKVKVEKTDWISAKKEELTFEVRSNWAMEEREIKDIEYYYFDESKENYLLVSTSENSAGLLKNAPEDLATIVGLDVETVTGVDLEKNDIVTVGNDIGGMMIQYSRPRVGTDTSEIITEFYTVYGGKIHWFYASFTNQYNDDYKEDVEHIFDSLNTVDGKGNPIIAS